MKTESVAWVLVAVAAVFVVGFWMFSDGGTEGLVDNSVDVVPTNQGNSGAPLPTTQPKPSTNAGTGAVPVKPISPTSIAKPQVTGLLSINHLLNLSNASYTCTFTVASPYRAGTFDLAGHKWRGDFGNNVSMVNDGKSIYVWTKGESDGLKVAAASGAVGESLRREGAIDAFTPLAYKCTVSNSDPSRFVPPDLLYKNSEGLPYL